MNNSPDLHISAIPDIPLIQAGDDLFTIIWEHIKQAEITLKHHDIMVISSKIVSKAEGRLIKLEAVQPSDEAYKLAAKTRKDPRLVELVLQESTEVSRTAPGVLVTQHRLGFISANAGIDQSNIGPNADQYALLLPENPDHTAEMLQSQFIKHTGLHIGIVISDSHGRPFRMGNIGVAIGVAGLPAIRDLRGQRDLYDRELRISIQGYADLIASAAHLVCGEGDEGRPVILVRGLEFSETAGKATDLNRPVEQDLYR